MIRQLAETESCVIIGRCANMILKDYSNVLRVFVYGDWDFRIREASKKLSGTTKDIEKFMHKDDKRKEDFCKRFMGVDWADMTKYNLCLDNGTLGYEKCVEEIESALEILKNKTYIREYSPGKKSQKSFPGDFSYIVEKYI